MLSEPEVTADRLAEICAAYGFDGWLINIEADVPPALLPALIEFVQLLTLCCKTRLGEHALVLFYDSLDASTGKVSYQNALTPANMPFFDACDGIFTNYWWDAAALKASARHAGDARKYDVYAGVECFARAPHPRFTMPYTSGTGCVRGVNLVAEAGLSLALFAPGWSLECGEAKGKSGADATRCDAMFWAALNIDRLRS